MANKNKTKRGAAKRFKLTATGKVKRKKANANHILTKKPKKRKCSLRTTGLVSKNDEKAVKQMLGN